MENKNKVKIPLSLAVTIFSLLAGVIGGLLISPLKNGITLRWNNIGRDKKLHQSFKAEFGTSLPPKADTPKSQIK